MIIGAWPVIGLAVFWQRDVATQQAIAQEILDLDSFQDLVRQEILDGLKSEYQSASIDWGQQTEEQGSARAAANGSSRIWKRRPKK